MNNINIHSTVFMREHFLKYHLIENVYCLSPNDSRSISLSYIFDPLPYSLGVDEDLNFILFYCNLNNIDKKWKLRRFMKNSLK